MPAPAVSALASLIEARGALPQHLCALRASAVPTRRLRTYAARLDREPIPARAPLSPCGRGVAEGRGEGHKNFIAQLLRRSAGIA
jgi:hypothetical protein